MKNYTVTFIVQAKDVHDALSQAEGYLNTGDRCVDCNVEATVWLDENRTMPVPAKRLEEP